MRGGTTGCSTYIVREFQLVVQQLPSIEAGFVDHSRQHLAPEVKGAVVAEVLTDKEKRQRARPISNKQTPTEKPTAEVKVVVRGTKYAIVAAGVNSTEERTLQT